MKNAWFGVFVGLVIVGSFWAGLSWNGLAVAEPLSVNNLPGSDEDADSPAKKAIPEVQEAVTKFRLGDTTGALESLRKAAETHPELPPAQVIMATLYASAKQGEAAQNALRKATQEAPNDPEAYIMLGQGALQSKRLTEAESILEKAESLLNDFKGTQDRKERLSAITHSLLAQLAMSQKNYAAAQSQLDALLKLKPDNAKARVMLARAMFEQEKYQEATEELKKAAAEDEEILTPDAILATWYEDKGDRKKAAELMKAALTAKPKDLKTRLQAAQWAFGIKNLEQAAEQAAIARQIDPDSLPAKLVSGNIAIFQGDYKTAEAFLTDAHLQSPANFTATNNLALALAEQDDEKKKQQAAQYASVNVRLYPKRGEPWSTFGWVMYQLGQLDQAEQALKQATQFPPISADTAYYIARVDVDRGRKDDAMKLLERALQSTSATFSKRADAEALLAKLKSGDSVGSDVKIEE